jgi:peptidoglycan/LPS O-acetylase OafA/YrhL
VQAFFVVSGFVIAHSVRNATPTARYVGNFTLRRSLRLSPPYCCVLALMLVLNKLSNRVRGERTIPFPGWDAVAAHVFYLQDILGYGDIVDIFWSLCFEMQMYLVFIVGLGSCWRLMGGRPAQQGPNLALLLLFFGLAGASLAHQGGWLPLVEKRWFLRDWYAFL